MKTCWKCHKPGEDIYLDVGFEAWMHPRCTWLCFYNGVLKPKGLKEWFKVLKVYLGIIKIIQEKDRLIEI